MNFSQINKNNLAYLETAQGTPSTNINLPPTTFIDAANQVLYVYYSNIKASGAEIYFDQYIQLVGSISLGLLRDHRSSQCKGLCGAGATTVFRVRKKYAVQ